MEIFSDYRNSTRKDSDFGFVKSESNQSSKIIEKTGNLNVHWCENIVSAILESDYKTKLTIIENMKPSDDESKFAKERNKKLRELKIRLKEIDEDIMEKERLIDEFLKETSIFAQNVMIENDAFYC